MNATNKLVFFSNMYGEVVLLVCCVSTVIYHMVTGETIWVIEYADTRFCTIDLNLRFHQKCKKKILKIKKPKNQENTRETN